MPSSRGVSRSSSFVSSSDGEVMSTGSQETSESQNYHEERGQMNSMVETRQSRRRTFRRSNTEDASSSSSTGQQSRRMSWPSFRHYSKRAIANLVDEAPPSAQDMPSQKARAEDENGVITYTANLLGNRPRIMDVCIPKVTEEGIVSSVWKRHVDASLDMGEDETMMTRFKQLQQYLMHPDSNIPQGDEPGRNPREFGLTALQNRPPWWNAELGAFVLNFGGRVSVASVKNFQLCERNDQDNILLQFGRVGGRHSFTMDFQHPLSAVQAFAIAISSLQSKISFG